MEGHELVAVSHDLEANLAVRKINGGVVVVYTGGEQHRRVC